MPRLDPDEVNGLPPDTPLGIGRERDPLPFSFADVARRYDLLNRLMSLGCDQSWRRAAAIAVALPPGGRALDVGVGTGDMALALHRQYPDGVVFGVEPVIEMMQAGRKKPGAVDIRWTQGDGLRLPYSSEAFDCVTSAFLLRNVPDVTIALAEQYRVLRAGGHVGCLEMTWPRTPGFRTLFRFYFSTIVPRIMGLLSRQSVAYHYLPRSVEKFMTPEALKYTMETVGFRNVHYRMLMLGTVTLHVGERP